MFKFQVIVQNWRTSCTHLATSFRIRRKLTKSFGSVVACVSHSRKGIPSSLSLGDSVIGIVADRRFEAYSLDIGAPSYPTLPILAREMSEVVETREKEEKYIFGPWKIDAREVFLTTEHCYCFVNLRPVVPGHVLVATKKLVPRFTDLTLEEVTDLWVTAQKVGQKLEPFFKATSLTLAIQDGPEAGQTVPHVHVHILPRKKEDFEKNDVIYDELEKKEKELNEAKKEEEKHLNLDEERKDRTRQEMFEEASELRSLFQ